MQNDRRVTAIEPEGDLLRVTAQAPNGAVETYYTRKIVLATGQDGMGEWWMPDDVRALPQHLRAHAADEIDFASLKGKTVAVLGAGASAFDNAATALENGAAEIRSRRTVAHRAARDRVVPQLWPLERARIDPHIGPYPGAGRRQGVVVRWRASSLHRTRHGRTCR